MASANKSSYAEKITQPLPVYSDVGSSARQLVEHYTDMLALGWRSRFIQFRDATQDFSCLYAYDSRLNASIDALIHLNKDAKYHLHSLLEEPVRSGEMFVLTLYALRVRDKDLLNACQALTIAIPDLQSAWIEAFQWGPVSDLFFSEVKKSPFPVRLRLLGMRHRDYAGIDERMLLWLRQNINRFSDEELLAVFEMLTYIGKSNFTDVAVKFQIEHDNENVRLAAVQLLLTQHPKLLRLKALTDLVDSSNAQIRSQAVRCAMLHAPENESRNILAWLKGNPAFLRLYIQALGWSGKNDAIPVLMSFLAVPEYSRLAGAMLGLITGSDPLFDKWMIDKPVAMEVDKDDLIPEIDPDGKNPWPDPLAFAKWWQTHQTNFDSDLRYFLGRPVSLEWLTVVIKQGPLAWRELAAELHQRLAHGPLFPTTFPAAQQHIFFSELDTYIQGKMR